MVRAAVTSLVVTLASSIAAQALDPDVAWVQFENGIIRDAAFGDFNADGRPDMVVSVFRDGIRWLSVHHHRGERPVYRSQPDHELRLVKDVVAYAVADVAAEPGAELVLFSPTRAVSVRWNEGVDEPRYAPIARIDLLWQPAKKDYSFSLQQGVTDLDGDGLADLLISELDGYRALVQRRDASGAVDFIESRLSVPPKPLTSRLRSERRFRDRSQNLRGAIDIDDQRQRGFLLQVWDTLAAPQVADWNADGRLDVVALAGSRLAVWLQSQESRYPTAPSELHEVPERGIPLFDPSFSVQLVDVEADGRAEVLVVSGRTDGDKVSSVVELFRQDDNELFDTAIDKMLIQGFTDVPTLDDVDGDGVAELTIGSLRTDVIDTLTAGSSGSVEAQLNVFVGRPISQGGRFRRPVALVHRVSIPGSALRSRDRMLKRFVRDVDGNGLRDLFLRIDRTQVVVLPTTARGRGFEVGDPIWSLKTADDAPIRVVEHPDSLSVIVIERDQIAHVEFR